MRKELLKRPHILICSAEFLSSEETRNLLLDCRLCSPGRRPVICIDECQVLDHLFGWTGFRESYGRNTWNWLVAAFKPRLLLSSASLSEESLGRVCGTLGISRAEVKAFYKDPSRANVYQQVREVPIISSRYRARNLGFLIPLAASGRKIQVFVPTMDEMDKSCEWLKEKLAEAEIEVPVQKVSGNCSATEKERAMESFRTGTSGVLFSTDVAAMGVHFPGLCIGVSLGIANTLWKLLQISGRLGRGVGENSIFITVAPKKHTMRASPLEKAEVKRVRQLFASDQCINKGLFESFQIQNPEVSYPDLVPVGGRCKACWCCSKCTVKCQQSEGNCETESKDDIAMRVLGIQRDTEHMKRARAFKRLVEREEGEYFSDSDAITGDSDADSE